MDHDKKKKEAVVPHQEKEFLRIFTELSVELAPRRFSLCEIHGNYIDGRIYAWGMAFDNKALLFHPDDSAIGISRSAENALTLWSRTRNLRLIWIDPQCNSISQEYGGET